MLKSVVMRQRSTVTASSGQTASRLIAETDSSQLDRLLISCRRLCVDNHLNQTLHNSILETGGELESNCVRNKLNQQPLKTTVSATSAKLGDLNAKIKDFYSSIPILLHDSSPNQRSMYKFLSGVCGKNVKICQPDCLIAYRESSIVQLKER